MSRSHKSPRRATNTATDADHGANRAEAQDDNAPTSNDSGSESLPRAPEVVRPAVDVAPEARSAAVLGMRDPMVAMSASIEGATTAELYASTYLGSFDPVGAILESIADDSAILAAALAANGVAPAVLDRALYRIQLRANVATEISRRLLAAARLEGSR